MRVLFHTSAAIVGGGEMQLKYLVENLPAHIKPFITYDRLELKGFVESIKAETCFTLSPNRLYLTLHNIRPEVVQFYHSPTFVRAIKRSAKFCPVIEVVHNRHPFVGDAMSYTKELNDVTVCVSPDAEAYVLRVAPDIKTKVIPNGIDTRIFKPGGPKSARSRPLGGFTGRLEKGLWKGIPQLLEAVAGLDIDFELVGQDFGDYQRHLPHNVWYSSYTTNVVKFYHAWDFFVSASPSEGFGLSIAEALACGLPSVIYNCGGICHYLENGRHAIIIQDYAQLQNAIKHVTQTSLSPTEVDFSATKMADSYAALYEELVGVEPAIEITGQVERLAIVPKGWYGVRRALKPLTDAEADPTTNDAVRKIRAIRPKLIVLGCYFPTWSAVLEEAKRVGARVICTWHASFVLNEFDNTNRDGMCAMIAAYREGLIHRLATPHAGLAKTFTQLGIATDYLPNMVTELQVATPLPGINIGIFGTGLPWKNAECQIVAASLVPGAIIHVQQLKHMSVLQALGIKVKVHPNYIPKDEDYHALIGGMTVNMVVSLSEVYSYYAAESMMMGVPILTTPITPIVKGSVLEPVLTTPYFEDPIEIVRVLTRLITDKESLRDPVREHMLATNYINKSIVDKVTAEWLK